MVVDSSSTSRRKFLAVAGVGAAGVGVAGAVPSLASTKHQEQQQTKLSPLTSTVVLTVEDAKSGTFNILVGERSVQITDLEFASRIAKAIA